VCEISAPTEAPRHVVTTQVDNTTLYVRWVPPRKSTWNGPLLGYQVRYNYLLYGADSRHEMRCDVVAQAVKIASSVARIYLVSLETFSKFYGAVRFVDITEISK